MENEKVIGQTKKWIADVVAACNFCPFVAKEIKANTIFYQVESSGDSSECLQAFLKECTRLNKDITIATTLLIFPNAFHQFYDYLDAIEMAEKLLEENDYEGIYQVAGFHPQYMFADAPVNDAANYTNRSIYPMFHILREAQITHALEKYPSPENIPLNNINFARKKGVQYMKMLRDGCL